MGDDAENSFVLDLRRHRGSPDRDCGGCASLGCPTATDPDEILRHTAAVVRSMREEYGDIVRLVLSTAPHSPEVAADLAVATKRYRDAIEAVATRLRDVGGLRDGLSVAEASDILWFYFGYSGYFTLHDDNGWTYQRAEHWPITQAATALGPGVTQPGD